jgi:hypothetical protein
VKLCEICANRLEKIPKYSKVSQAVYSQRSLRLHLFWRISAQEKHICCRVERISEAFFTINLYISYILVYSNSYFTVCKGRSMRGCRRKNILSLDLIIVQQCRRLAARICYFQICVKQILSIET